MSENSYCRDLICPRCGKKEVKKIDIASGRTKGIQIKCDSCGLELVGDNWADMKDIWNVSKKKRVEYAIRTLKSFGNAYIGRFTLEVWKKSNICKYLSEQVGSRVRKRSPREMLVGAVLYTE